VYLLKYRKIKDAVAAVNEVVEEEEKIVDVVETEAEEAREAVREVVIEVEVKAVEEIEIEVKVIVILEAVVKTVSKNVEPDLEMINQSSLENVEEEVTNQNRKALAVNAVEEFNFYFTLN
jgi:hypothetical protein